MRRACLTLPQSRGLRSQSNDLRAQLRTQPLPSPNWSRGAAAAPLLYRERAAAPLAAIYSPFIPLAEARGGGANGPSPAAAKPAAILRGFGAGGGRGSARAWRRPVPHGAVGTKPPPRPISPEPRVSPKHGAFTQQGGQRGFLLRLRALVEGSVRCNYLPPHK